MRLYPSGSTQEQREFKVFRAVPPTEARGVERRDLRTLGALGEESLPQNKVWWPPGFHLDLEAATALLDQEIRDSAT